MKRKHYTWTLPRTTIELGKRTAVMGILNVTPDSFSDGGVYFDRDKAIARAYEIQEQGADILDIGGESSRPGSEAISADEELRRVIPIIEALKLRIPISVDTYRAGVARRALDAGAQIINDISAFRFDSEMPAVAREYRAAVVLMHSRGTREELHTQPPMADPVTEVARSLQETAALAASTLGGRDSIVLDPGIGFGKRAEQSLRVLSHLEALSPLEYPLLVGTSRKSFIGKIAPSKDGPLWGTIATVAHAVTHGAHIVRVHDVQQIRILVDVLDAIEAC